MNKQKVENFSSQSARLLLEMAKRAAYDKEFEQRCLSVCGWDKASGSDVVVFWPGGKREMPVIGKTTFRVKGEKK